MNRKELIDLDKYQAPSDEELKKRLSNLEYDVIKNGEDEEPFTGEYVNNEDVGLYVDKISGAPLFLSKDKFDSGCGWPSFTRPIDSSVLKKIPDNRNNRHLIEVISRAGGARLGHVFGDGPQDKGGLRFCINSAALRFIPYKDLEKEGYGALKPFFEDI